MRIIAGSAKGQHIKAPKGSETRPTSDKVREAIFSTIGAQVKGAKVLDLYAGSGALGIEALSRGAQFATFVDLSVKAIRIIKENLLRTKFSKKAEVIKKTSKSFLMSTKMNQYNLIFIDAPYKMSFNKLFSDTKNPVDLLAKDGLLVFEHHLSTEIGRKIKVDKTKRYGNTKVAYIRKKGENICQ